VRMVPQRAAVSAFPADPRPGVLPGRGRPVGAGRAAADGWDGAQTLPLRGLRWNLVFIGLLLYTFAVVTYRLPLGTAGMVLGLLALPFGAPVRMTPLLAWFGAFLGWAALSAYSSGDPAAAGDAVIEMAKLWIVVLVAWNALRTRRLLQVFLAFLLLCFAVYPVRGAIFNFVFYGHATFGRAIWNHIYANPNDLAALTLLQLGTAGAIFATERHRLVRFGAMASLVVLPILILMTQSRGALLALALFGLLSLRGSRRKLRNIGLLAALCAAVIMIAPNDVWTRASGLLQVESAEDLEKADPEQSAKSRYEILKVAVRITRDHPIWGVGLDRYAVTHADYTSLEPITATARGKADTHNTYLNVAAETGLPGLGLFLGMIAFVLLRAERTRRRLASRRPRDATALWMMELGLVAYLAAGLFGSFGRLTHLYMYMVLILAMAETALLAASAAVPRARRQNLARLRRKVPFTGRRAHGGAAFDPAGARSGRTGDPPLGREIGPGRGAALGTG